MLFFPVFTDPEGGSYHTKIGDVSKPCNIPERKAEGKSEKNDCGKNKSGGNQLNYKGDVTAVPSEAEKIDNQPDEQNNKDRKPAERPDVFSEKYCADQTWKNKKYRNEGKKKHTDRDSFEKGKGKSGCIPKHTAGKVDEIKKGTGDKGEPCFVKTPEGDKGEKKIEKGQKEKVKSAESERRDKLLPERGTAASAFHFADCLPVSLH